MSKKNKLRLMGTINLRNLFFVVLCAGMLSGIADANNPMPEPWFDPSNPPARSGGNWLNLPDWVGWIVGIGLFTLAGFGSFVEEGDKNEALGVGCFAFAGILLLAWIFG